MSILTELRTVRRATPAMAKIAVDRRSFFRSKCIKARRPRKVVTDMMLEQPGVTAPVRTSPDFEMSSNWVPCHDTGNPARPTILAERFEDRAAKGSPNAHWRNAGAPTPIAHTPA